MAVAILDRSGLQRIETETLGRRVYNELRDFLIVGGLQPGERVTLKTLTEAVGTSPMPVREAVQRLAAEGALELLPNRAIRVPILSKPRVNEILRLRLMLEGLAVAEAAGRIAKAEIGSLEEIHEAFTIEMGNRDGSTRLFRLNKEFHFTIYRASGMPVLLGIIENLWLQIGPYLHFSLGARGRQAASGYVTDAHKRLIEAMRRRDPALGQAALGDDLRGAVDLMMRFANLPDGPD